MIKLNPVEMLEIYLTQRGLKPACLLGRCLTRKGMIINERASLPEEFRELLESTEKPFEERVRIVHGEVLLNFYLGKNKRCLDRLTNAKTDYEFGVSLGYPLESIDSYLTYVNGELKSGSYMHDQITKAVRANLTIPRWIIYISHIPKHLDLVNGRVSESSRMQGEFYEKYIRINNPELAKSLQDEMENYLEKIRQPI